MAQQTTNLQLWLPDIGTANWANLINNNFLILDKTYSDLQSLHSLPGGSVSGELIMAGVPLSLSDKSDSDGKKVSMEQSNSEDAKSTYLDIKGTQLQDIRITTKANKTYSLCHDLDARVLTSTYNNKMTEIGSWTNKSGEFKKAADDIGTFHESGKGELKKVYDAIHGNTDSVDADIKTLTDNIGTFTPTTQATEKTELGKVKHEFSYVGTYNPLYSENAEMTLLGRARKDSELIKTKLDSIHPETTLKILPNHLYLIQGEINIPFEGRIFGKQTLQGNFNVLGFSHAQQPDQATPDTVYANISVPVSTWVPTNHEDYTWGMCNINVSFKFTGSKVTLVLATGKCAVEEVDFGGDGVCGDGQHRYSYIFVGDVTVNLKHFIDYGPNNKAPV